jgi:hypothetical protein
MSISNVPISFSRTIAIFANSIVVMAMIMHRVPGTRNRDVSSAGLNRTLVLIRMGGAARVMFRSS